MQPIPVQSRRYVACPQCGTAVIAEDYFRDGCWNCQRLKNGSNGLNKSNSSNGHVTGAHLSLSTCPDCGEKALKRENGCVTCLNCAYSKCDT
jgi:predicted RNA-binding Zn-ribbon protein involved in translation (DUF1610 family)